MSTPQKKNALPTWLIILLILLALCLLIGCIAAYYIYQASQKAIESGTQQINNLQLTATALAQTFETTLLAPLATVPAAEATPAPPGAQTGVTGASPVIYLAGRTDITIPPLDQPYEGDLPLFMCRGAMVQETFPPGYAVLPGAEIQITAQGLINFYGGPAEEGYPPDGEPYGTLSGINAFGGISTYLGPQGSLVGVFLDEAIPTGEAPAPLNFGPVGESEGAIGLDFARLEPQTGQVFFIGDGQTSTGITQIFIAPPNATRLYIGLADAAFFFGDPSCYADNTGSYTFTVTGNPAVEPLK